MASVLFDPDPAHSLHRPLPVAWVPCPQGKDHILLGAPAVPGACLPVWPHFTPLCLMGPFLLKVPGPHPLCGNKLLNTPFDGLVSYLLGLGSNVTL